MRASLGIAGTTPLQHFRLHPDWLFAHWVFARVHAFGGGERYPATIKVTVAVEEFPDGVDLIALGVLFVQGAFSWQGYGIR
jgi:hypothetical protein